MLDASTWIEAILTSDQKNVEEAFEYSARSGILSVWFSIMASLSSNFKS
mgnify:CR=1 FL=1